jgi:hypothetical protein
MMARGVKVTHQAQEGKMRGLYGRRQRRDHEGEAYREQHDVLISTKEMGTETERKKENAAR